MVNKSEIRNPHLAAGSEMVITGETRVGKGIRDGETAGAWLFSDFGLRISFGFRPSDFGF
jgi:hypothetical protein